MSYLTLSNGFKFSIGDLDVISYNNVDNKLNHFYNATLKNAAGSMQQLFSSFTVGERVTFLGGFYAEITKTYTTKLREFHLFDKTGKDIYGPIGMFTDEPLRGPYFYKKIGNNEVFISGGFLKHDNASSSDRVSPLPGPVFNNNYSAQINTLNVFPWYGIILDPPEDTSLISKWWGDGITVDEYFPGSGSDSGGGTGNFDKTGDDIGFQNLPSLSAIAAGFVTLYRPTVSEMNALANYLWTSDFVTNVKKLFSDPMDAILGLSIVPVDVPSRGSRNVKVGFIDTGITMNEAMTQYVQVDCGELTIKEYWGSALDYSPYTKTQLYLPYIGIREINTDDIMGKTVHIIYNVDILSGGMTAQIKCGSSVLYQFSGQCACSIPVTGRDFSQTISAAISSVGAVGSLVASGGASGPISASMAVSGVMTCANNVTNAKPRIEHSGNMSSTGGLMGVQTPYFIIERPRQSLANKYNTYVGYPSNITTALTSITGYTEIESIRLQNIAATQTELDEIETLLKEGVIL